MPASEGEGTRVRAWGPRRHYAMCRRVFGQSRVRALRSVWLAYVVNRSRPDA
jgi:hypothetical protein